MSGTLLRIIVAVVIAILIAPGASARVINYKLSGVTFDDTATATGTLSFDTDSGQYVAVDIKTLHIDGPPVFPGRIYKVSHIISSSSNDSELAMSMVNSGLPDWYSSAGDQILDLWFDGSLTAGGTVNLLTGFTSGEGRCLTFDTICTSTLVRWAAAGSVMEVAPIPAAVWLFGSALGLLGWMRRKTI